MLVLALDIGTATGYVLFDATERRITQMGTLKATEVETTVSRLVADHYLIEKMPRHMGPEIGNTYEGVKQLLPPTVTEEIFPGTWKPLAKRLKWKQPAAQTTHEADAYHMLRFWFRKTRCVDIGVLSYARV